MITTITLEAHHCDNRHSYLVAFEGETPAAAEAQAIAFYHRKASTHAFHIPEDGDVMQRPAQYPTLWDLLNPTCEHGMSAWLCFGPAHYVSNDELAMGW